MFNLNHIKKSSEYIAFTSLLWGSPSDTRKFIMPQVNYLIKLGSVSILFVQFYYLKFLNYLQGTVSWTDDISLYLNQTVSKVIA